MNLRDYFENTEGTGILSTADAGGRVNAAIYSRPHVFEDGTIGLIARQRLTHANLQENPQAAYLFLEAGEGYRGKRLYLTKLSEEKESERLYQLKRRHHPPGEDLAKGPKYLMIFRVDRELPLVGDK